MIRKYHNHTLQTTPRHREEQSQNTNSHKTAGRATSSLFLIKVTVPQAGHKTLNNKTSIIHRTPTNNESNNKHWINNNRTTALERTAV